MNVFGKRERSWRKARKRGVSPIIATILLVAITVVLAAVLYVLISGLTTGGSTSTPIGGAFAFGTAQQTSSTTTCTTGDTCYSVGIASAGSSATTANIKFSLQASGVGTTFTSVAVVSLSGSVVACYMGTGSWVGANSGGTACGTAALTSPQSLTSTQSLILDPGTGTHSGDQLVAAGTGALQGTVSVTLP